MRFELTDALIDELLFFMEDQSGDFLLDTHKGIVINVNDDSGDDDDDDETELDDDERYISFPDWGPSEGFRLMERFTSELRNPLRTELSAALDRGKGVFRAFKDTLSKNPEVEKLWFAYKENRMKKEIIRWYNALREEWGMTLIGAEPEDIDGITREDFYFREGTAADTQAAEKLHRVCVGSDGKIEISPWIFPGDICVVGESSGGEFAAYASAVYTTPDSLHISALEVAPEYRGLGLGKTLLTRLLKQAEKITAISADLPAENENFSRVLKRESFEPRVTRYYRAK